MYKSIDKRMVVIILLLVCISIIFLLSLVKDDYTIEAGDVLVLENHIINEGVDKDITPPIEIVLEVPISTDIIDLEVESEIASSMIADPVTIKFDVPYTPQAPFAEWSDSRQQDACEEASALMAVYWARGQGLLPQEAKDKILSISDWEKETYGLFQDTSAEDTVERIFKGYFEYDKVEVINNITLQDIIGNLEKGSLVIVPADGRALKNRFFQTPGPERHMLVIIGYNYETKQFITNDPGTKNGKGYVYNEDILFNAIRDYPTGSHEHIVGIKKTMIVVQK